MTVPNLEFNPDISPFSVKHSLRECLAFLFDVPNNFVPNFEQYNFEWMLKMDDWLEEHFGIQSLCVDAMMPVRGMTLNLLLDPYTDEIVHPNGMKMNQYNCCVVAGGVPIYIPQDIPKETVSCIYKFIFVPHVIATQIPGITRWAN